MSMTSPRQVRWLGWLSGLGSVTEGRYRDRETGRENKSLKVLLFSHHGSYHLDVTEQEPEARWLPAHVSNIACMSLCSTDVS